MKHGEIYFAKKKKALNTLRKESIISKLQVMREGSSDVLNKLYETTVDKLEAMKSEYEALRKRYNENTASHNADLSRLDQFEEENHRLQKTLDILSKQRDAAIHYQQQFSTSVQR